MIIIHHNDLKFCLITIDIHHCCILQIIQQNIDKYVKITIAQYTVILEYLSSNYQDSKFSMLPTTSVKVYQKLM